MNEASTNTAADRLFRIVRDLASINPNEPLLNAWGKALRLPSAERLDVFRGILSMSALVDEVEVLVLRAGSPSAKLYQRSLVGVRHILTSNLDGVRAQLTNHLSPQLVNDLEHCAATYSLMDHEITVPPELVSEIKNKLETLFQDLKSSQLPDELRAQLLDLVEVMRQLISQFEIRGSAVLKDCLRQAVARMAEMYPVVQNHKSDPILKRLSGVISDIATVCERAQKALPILKIAAKILPFFSSEAGHQSIPETIEVESHD